MGNRYFKIIGYDRHHNIKTARVYASSKCDARYKALAYYGITIVTDVFEV